MSLIRIGGVHVSRYGRLYICEKCNSAYIQIGTWDEIRPANYEVCPNKDCSNTIPLPSIGGIYDIESLKWKRLAKRYSNSY